MILIHFTSRFEFLYWFSIDFSASWYHNSPVDSYFGPTKGQNEYIWSKSKAQGPWDVFKLFGFTFLVDSISLLAFLLISVHPGTLLDQWTSISSPKMAKIAKFVRIWRLKVRNIYFKWFRSTLIVDCMSLVAFLLISVHPDTSLDLWTFIAGPKWLKSVYNDDNNAYSPAIRMKNDYESYIYKTKSVSSSSRNKPL